MGNKVGPCLQSYNLESEHDSPRVNVSTDLVLASLLLRAALMSTSAGTCLKEAKSILDNTGRPGKENKN